mmetsp:Transcript_114074/g.295381  ORF Transcript_114074/g.295381 Transcript_114074/m.295381 type:complete len:220 (+) Transcript_114074:3-662(+)
MASRLSWTGGHGSALPSSHQYTEVDWQRRIAGYLRYHRIPVGVPLRFAFGASGYFSTQLTEPIEGLHMDGESSSASSVVGSTAVMRDEHADHVEPEEAAAVAADLAGKLRAVAELRRKLRNLRTGGSGDTGGSVGFEMMRSRSRNHIVMDEPDNATEPGSQDPDANLCIVCVEGLRNSVLLWCGHQVLCLRCAKTLSARTARCPICRAPIEQVQQVFAS